MGEEEGDVRYHHLIAVGSSSWAPPIDERSIIGRGPVTSKLVRASVSAAPVWTHSSHRGVELFRGCCGFTPAAEDSLTQPYRLELGSGCWTSTSRSPHIYHQIPADTLTRSFLFSNTKGVLPFIRTYRRHFRIIVLYPCLLTMPMCCERGWLESHSHDDRNWREQGKCFL